MTACKLSSNKWAIAAMYKAILKMVVQLWVFGLMYNWKDFIYRCFDVCLLVPPLEQYWFFGAIASLPVVVCMSASSKRIYLVGYFKNTEIYHRKWQTAAMLEMVATLVILGDAKRDLSCLYYWLNWAKYHHSLSWNGCMQIFSEQYCHV